MGLVVCASCHETRPLKGRGLCNACYQRAKPKAPRARPLKVCTRCGKLAPFKGRGLCQSCHAAQQPKRKAACASCGEVREIVAKGLCDRCRCASKYVKRLLPTPEACGTCGQAAEKYVQGKCPTCWDRTYRRERYATDPEFRFKRKGYVRRYYAQLSEAHGSHTRAEWLARIAEFNGCCAYCLRPLALPTRDHMTPVTWPAGTSDAIENIVPACSSCNSSKGDRTLVFWIFEQAKACAVVDTTPGAGVTTT